MSGEKRTLKRPERAAPQFKSLAVRCPRCNAQPGDSCRHMQTGRTLSGVHRDRHFAFWMASQ